MIIGRHVTDASADRPAGTIRSATSSAVRSLSTSTTTSATSSYSGRRSASSAAQAPAGIVVEQRAGPRPCRTRATSVSHRRPQPHHRAVLPQQARGCSASRTTPPAAAITVGVADARASASTWRSQRPEGGLAVGPQDLGDRAAGARLDLAVAVEQAQPRRRARRRPTVVLPAPIIPTSTIDAASRAVTGQPVTSEAAGGDVDEADARGCARARPPSRRRTCAGPRRPAPAPPSSRPPRPWPARR